MNNTNFNFKEEIKNNPDQFCVEVITDTGMNGMSRTDFPNFAEALKYYPDLDKYTSGKRFTWAMNGGFCKDHNKPMMRFEDWQVNYKLSL